MHDGDQGPIERVELGPEQEWPLGAVVSSPTGPNGVTVASVVPAGFDRYTRILHPFGGDDPAVQRTWASLAAEFGLVTTLHCRAGSTRFPRSGQVTWIQPTPGDAAAIVLLESDDLATSLYGIATSNDPFDAWFRAHLGRVHGTDLAAGMHLPEQVLDYRA